MRRLFHDIAVAGSAGGPSFVADAHDAATPEVLTVELLDRLTELLGCEYATYEALDWQKRIVIAYVPCSNEGASAVPKEYPEIFWTWTDDKSPHWMDAPFQRLSDIYGRRERERDRDEHEWNAEFRIVDKLAFPVGDRRTRSGKLHFESQHRDFDERARELALCASAARGGALAEIRWAQTARRARVGARAR